MAATSDSTRTPDETTPPAASAAAWATALAAERLARAAMDKFREEVMDPVNRAFRAGTATARQVDQAEDDYSALTLPFAHAVEDVLLAPAPTFTAIRIKLEMALAEGLYEGTTDRAGKSLRVLLADLRRLEGERA